MTKESTRTTLDLQKELSEAVGGNLTLFDVADSHTGELMARSADGGLEIPLEVLRDLVYGDEDDNED